jgi:uncharacterized membrane protein
MNWTHFVLIAITLVGGLLRFYAIGDKGLWLDEAFSVWMGWQSLPELFEWLVRIDQHPPLYYTLLHFWLWLGDGEAQARSLSALMGTLTIPVIFLIGRRMAGAGVGLIAAFILALSPFHVRFAQEARMYTLLTLNASLAILALTCLLTDDRAATLRIGRQFGHALRSLRTTDRATPRVREVSTDLAWVGYIVFTTAALLTHNTTVFFPLAANLFVLGLIAVRRRWPSATHLSVPALTDFEPPTLRNWLLTQLSVFLLWSPWLAPFIIQSVGVYQEFWIPPPTWGVVVETLRTFIAAFSPGAVGVLSLFLAALFVGLGLFHLRGQPAAAIFLITLFLTPFVGEWLVSLRRPIFYDRTLIWTTIPLYLLLACGIRQLNYRWVMAVTLVGFTVISLLSLQNYYRHFQKEEWREAAAYMATHVQDDDLILFNATWVQIPFDYYFRTANSRAAKHGAPVDLFDRGILEPKMGKEDLPRLRSLLRNRERVWLVYSHDWYTDPERLIPRALEVELDLVERRKFYGLEIRRYQPR